MTGYEGNCGMIGNLRKRSGYLRTLIAAATVAFVGATLSACQGTDDQSTGVNDAVSGVHTTIGLGQFTAQGTAIAANPHHYRIGLSDVLEISVFDVPDLTRSAQVNGDGTIMLPLIGSVNALQRTPRELEADIAGRLKARFLQSPQVSVYVKEYNSQRFTVEGAVNRPGVYPLIGGQASLIRAVAVAGGLDRVADPSNVVVFRLVSGQRMAARFDLASLRSGTAPDPEVLSGDVIIVDTSGPRSALRDFLQLLPVSGLFLAVL